MLFIDFTKAFDKLVLTAVFHEFGMFRQKKLAAKDKRVSSFFVGSHSHRNTGYVIIHQAIQMG